MCILVFVKILLKWKIFDNTFCNYPNHDKDILNILKNNMVFMQRFLRKSNIKQHTQKLCFYNKEKRFMFICQLQNTLMYSDLWYMYVYNCICTRTYVCMYKLCWDTECWHILCLYCIDLTYICMYAYYMYLPYNKLIYAYMEGGGESNVFLSV